ncbi:hypothetical protein I0P70_07175 [Pontibacter sp. FD36]|uniref:hypothetical protein n=1 Tax=Pontibacter sp. FD36 TaxID=2789860 RepID=UPI0018AB91DE|nr:hypothetical protein [Pontibacter sp. FD36]MBF8963020.1 hypothetical protein [Pontibacter sp. FD36]
MRIQAVVRKGHIKEMDEREDLLYWLDCSPRERMKAVTFIISSTSSRGKGWTKPL